MKKKTMLIIGIFSFMVSFSAFSDEDIDTQKILSMAESAFKNGIELLDSDDKKSQEYFNEAAIYYKSLIDSGIENSSLYYNLGNTYYRLNKIGFAILNYRKALLYSPGDKQIRYNLEYVRSLQKNGFEINTQNEIFHIVFFLHFLVPEGVKITILLLSNICFWGLLILFRFGRKIKTPVIISLSILLITAASVFIDLKESKILHGVVTAEKTIGRLGDSTAYEAAFEDALYQGVEFTIKQKRPGWLLVELPNSVLAWLETDDCGIVEEQF